MTAEKPIESSRPSPLRAGLLMRCPQCAVGPLYRGLLTVRPACIRCGFDLGAADSGDGPAFFVITVLGFIMVGLAAWVELAYEPPLWLHLLIWPPAIIGGSILLLRIFKAILIAWQVRLKVGFEE